MRTLAGKLALISIFCLSFIMLAGPKGGGGMKAPKDMGGRLPPTGNGLPPVDVLPQEQAKRAAVDVSDAKAELDAFVLEQDQKFKQSDEYAAATKDLDDALAALSAIETPLREKLKAGDVLYEENLKDQVRVQGKLDAAKAAKNMVEVKAETAHLAEIIKSINDTEIPVFTKNTSWKPAKERVAAAQKKVSELEVAHRRKLTTNPDYVALQTKLNNAKSHLSSLQQ